MSQFCLANQIIFSGSIVEDSCNVHATNYSVCSTKISDNTKYTLQQSPNDHILTLTYF